MLTDPIDVSDDRWHTKRVTTDPACITSDRLTDFVIFRYRNVLGADRAQDLVSIRLQTTSPTGKRYAY